VLAQTQTQNTANGTTNQSGQRNTSSADELQRKGGKDVVLYAGYQQTAAHSSGQANSAQKTGTAGRVAQRCQQTKQGD
jgi:hypothetical protein